MHHVAAPGGLEGPWRLLAEGVCLCLPGSAACFPAVLGLGVLNCAGRSSTQALLCVLLNMLARAPVLPSALQISAVLYIPLLKGRIFSAEEPVWNKRSLDVGVAEVRGSGRAAAVAAVVLALVAVTLEGVGCCGRTAHDAAAPRSVATLCTPLRTSCAVHQVLPGHGGLQHLVHPGPGGGELVGTCGSWASGAWAHCPPSPARQACIKRLFRKAACCLTPRCVPTALPASARRHSQVVEERCERYAAMLYPANAARNRALVNARTGASSLCALARFARWQPSAEVSPALPSPLQPRTPCCLACPCAEAILLVDVDFAVSRSLADSVADEESYGRLMAMLHARYGTGRGGAACWLPSGGCGLASGAHQPNQHAVAICVPPRRAVPTNLPAPAPACRPAAMPWCCPRLRPRTRARRASGWRWRQCARARSTWSTSSSEWGVGSWTGGCRGSAGGVRFGLKCALA